MPIYLPFFFFFSLLNSCIHHQDQIFPSTFQQVFRWELVNISLIFTSAPSGNTIIVPYITINPNKMEISMAY